MMHACKCKDKPKVLKKGHLSKVESEDQATSAATSPTNKQARNPRQEVHNHPNCLRLELPTKEKGKDFLGTLLI